MRVGRGEFCAAAAHYFSTHGSSRFGAEVSAIARFGGERRREVIQVRAAACAAPSLSKCVVLQICIANFEYSPSTDITHVSRHRSESVRPRSEAPRSLACLLAGAPGRKGAVVRRQYCSA